VIGEAAMPQVLGVISALLLLLAVCCMQLYMICLKRSGVRQAVLCSTVLLQLLL
jgi:hypothetical protein